MKLHELVDLYETICRDPRNRRNDRLWDGPLDERNFAGYSDFFERGFSAQASANSSAGRMFIMALRDDLLGSG